MSWVWGTSTPPPVSSAVFSVSGSIVISAPPEKVWQTLLDFDSYKQWNPFVRSQIILNNPNSAPLSVGHHIKLYPVHLPPTLDDANVGLLQTSSVLAEVTVLDHNNYRVAWRIAESGGAGVDVKCKYESYEVFKGILAYVRDLNVELNKISFGSSRRMKDRANNDLIGLKRANIH
ncbi:hypothetical protein LENED_001872 [Lentinula edodes]|uniref:Uncharacterized protein n=1 Tax=Lentinula edodes TaxID=5353 RepID=A0A1Q3DZB9_LENED|nr:hypothetical protein LENED_001872 [Lentinula edodes]